MGAGFAEGIGEAIITAMILCFLAGAALVGLVWLILHLVGLA